jgi:hypothetical protein
MREEPVTRRRSASSTRENDSSTRSRGTDSPKNTTSDSRADETLRDPKPEVVGVFQIGVAVRSGDSGEGEPARIRRLETVLILVAGDQGSAIEASDPIEPPMKVDDSPSARLLVKAVDVLGDEVMQASRLLQGCERAMRAAGRRVAHHGKAHHRASPVAAPCALVRDELLIPERRVSLPLTPLIAVVGNARLGADAGPGESHEATGAGDESGQRLDLGAQYTVHGIDEKTLAHRSRTRCAPYSGSVRLSG